MAPTAARRAHSAQRSCCQGLQGNPDACRPGRGSACNETAQKTGGDARLVFALSVQRTAAISPRSGGAGGTPPALSFPPLSFGKKAVPSPGRRAPRGVDTPVKSGASGMPRPPVRWRRAGAHTGAPLRIDSGQFLHPTRRATTGRPYGQRAESSRPTGQRLRGQAGG